MKRKRLTRQSEASDSKEETIERPRKTRTILDRRLIDSFCRLIRRGLPPDGVCDYLGIFGTTYYDWLRKGEAYLEGGCEPPALAIYGEFVLAFRQSTARYRLRLTKSLHRKGNRNWLRDIVILERRDRKTYSRNAPAGGSDEAYDPDDKFL